MSDRERTEIHRDSRQNQKGRELCLRLYDVKFGRGQSYYTFSLFEPFTFIRKNDSWDGKVKAGEEDMGMNYEFSMSRLPDALSMLYEIDRQFNQGKAFAALKKDILVSEARRKAMQNPVSLADDDIPF